MSYNRATGIMADELTKLPNYRPRGTHRAIWPGHSLWLWFGAMKFISYESQGISHWVANSPLLSWVYNIMSVDAFGRLNG